MHVYIKKLKATAAIDRTRLPTRNKKNQVPRDLATWLSDETDKINKKKSGKAFIIS